MLQSAILWRDIHTQIQKFCNIYIVNLILRNAVFIPFHVFLGIISFEIEPFRASRNQILS